MERTSLLCCCAENRLKGAGREAERWLGKAIIQVAGTRSGVAGTRSGMAGEWVVIFRHLQVVPIELLGEGCERAESLFLVLTGRMEQPFTRMKAAVGKTHFGWNHKSVTV